MKLGDKVKVINKTRKRLYGRTGLVTDINSDEDLPIEVWFNNVMEFFNEDELEVIE